MANKLDQKAAEAERLLVGFSDEVLQRLQPQLAELARQINSIEERLGDTMFLAAPVTFDEAPPFLILRGGTPHLSRPA